MATSSVSRYFRIMDCIPLRKMVLMNQTSYIHVDHMTCIRRKAQHLSTTKQSLRKTEKTNDVCSQIAPRAEKHLEGCKVKRVTVQSLLENIGFKVEKKNARIDVTKLSVEQVKKILSFLDEIGIEHQDKGKIISRRPGILTAKGNLLRMRVEAMKKAGIYPESVAYVVRESPGVLTGRTEISLPDKVMAQSRSGGGGGGAGVVGVLPYKRLKGICGWMGLHCHDWIDYNGVTFSIESLQWGHTFSDFWGKTVLHIYD